MIVIDYLQLIEGRRKENRVQEVSEISRFLKVLARELSVPVLALSQLSRAVEQRTGGTPQLSDLRESGSIEQDADIVMFIHREELYDPGTERKGMADLIIAKHRNGPTGSVELKFMREQARYRAIDNRHIQS
jgi:replicative DNA helicase